MRSQSSKRNEELECVGWLGASYGHQPQRVTESTFANLNAIFICI